MRGINYGRFISVYQSQDGGYVCIITRTTTKANDNDKEYRQRQRQEKEEKCCVKTKWS